MLTKLKNYVILRKNEVHQNGAERINLAHGI